MGRDPRDYGPIDSGASRPSTRFACLRHHAPPFFVALGDLDTYVPVEGARRFQAKLRRTSAQPVVSAELPGGQHSFDLFHSIRFESLLDGIEAFAAWGALDERSSDRGRPVTGQPMTGLGMAGCPPRGQSEGGQPCEES